MLIDEGESVSDLSSTALQALGCHPLGTLPQFPVTLGGKNIFIDVMVVQDPLDFSLLLG